MKSRNSSKHESSFAKRASRLLAGLLTVALAFGQALPAAVTAADEPEGEAAAPIVLVATDDATISQANPDVNYWNNGTLQVTHDGHPTNVRRIYLKFDLNGINLDDIRSGILQVYNIDTRYNSTIMAYETDGNNTEWNEGTITWNNAPAPGSAITAPGGGIASVDVLSKGTDASNSSEGAQYYEINVTNHLQNADDNGLLSIVLLSSAYTAFASKERSSGAYPPQLVLSSEEAEAPAEEPTGQLDDTGRSSLYPADWYPGFADEEGRFLHDFSYAGYRMGQEPPDVIPGMFLDVTEAPYGADNTGTEDATAIIQQALDDAGEAGGGVVYLPPGTYRIKPQGKISESLRISRSGVVLRGAGPEQTFLFNDEPVMRGKDIIAVTSERGQFQAIPGSETYIRLDLPEPTVHIPVQDASSFQPGDWVIINNKYTAGFIEEHQMTGWWNIYEGNDGITFYRKVVAVDAAANTITIDIPTRYPLKIRDFSNVRQMTPPVTEVGVEHLSIGNVENLTPGVGDSDYLVEGTGAYQVAGSKAIRFIGVVDAWARNIHSYRPSTNSAGYDYHILSSGITTLDSRNVTIMDTDVRKPLSRGGGGNGYLYELIGNDNLILNARAEEGRHNYSFSHMRTNGNVIRNSVSRNPYLVIDFHQYLSASNLLDGMVLDGDRIETSVRPYPSTEQTYRHGVTTSQTVIWNTRGVREHPNLNGIIIDSRQYGYGYIIGTQGNVTGVRVTPTLHSNRETAPVDFVEGLGQGDVLQPQSLYLDQLDRRIERQTVDLQTITLNGNPVAGFQPGKRDYKIALPYGTANVPVIAAIAASEGATVAVEQAEELPGTAVITVASDGQKSARYTVNLGTSDTPAALQQISLLPDRTKPGWNSGANMDNGTTAWLQVIGTMSDGTEVEFEEAHVTFASDNEAVLTVNGEGQVTAVASGAANVTVHVELGGATLAKSIGIVSAVVVPEDLGILPIVSVSSSGDDGNVVENIIDSDLATRWSASGEGQWAIADLGEVLNASSVSIAFYNGHLRKTIFELEVSVDGEQWTKVYDKIEGGNSSGTTNLFELFVFDEPHNARYVRFVGYGNNLNLWNSISELRIHPGQEEGGGGDDDNGEDSGTGNGVSPTAPEPGEDAIAESVIAEFPASGGPALIKSSLAAIEAPGNMFSGQDIGQDAKIAFVFTAADADQRAELDSRVQRAVGDRPIIAIAVTVNGEATHWSNPDAPVTVRIPYTPSEAELADPALLEKITVWRIDANGVATAIPNARYDTQSASVVFITTELMQFAIALEERSFGDLGTVPWARHEIEVLASKGVISGISTTDFAPRQNIRRADFTKLFVLALGLSAKAGRDFSDIGEDDYYEAEVAIAARFGIVNGYSDGSFRPAAQITRQEMMVIAARGLRAVGKLQGGDAAALAGSFTDTDDIAPYAMEDISALVQAGIIQGSGGLLNPQGAATRAEAAALLFRLMQL